MPCQCYRMCFVIGNIYIYILFSGGDLNGFGDINPSMNGMGHTRERHRGISGLCY